MLCVSVNPHIERVGTDLQCGDEAIPQRNVLSRADRAPLHAGRHAGAGKTIGDEAARAADVTSETDGVFRRHSTRPLIFGELLLTWGK